MSRPESVTFLQPPGIARPTALILADERTASAENLCRAMHANGLRTFVTPWPSVWIGPPGTYVSRGFELTEDGAFRQIENWESVFPRVLVHPQTMYGAAVQTFHAIAEAHPKAILSYSSELDFLSSARGSELCLRDGDTLGIRVPRPLTLLIPEEAESAVAQSSSVSLFAPKSGGSARLSLDKERAAYVFETLSPAEQSDVVLRRTEDPVVIHDVEYGIRVLASFDFLRSNYSILESAAYPLAAPVTGCSALLDVDTGSATARNDSSRQMPVTTLTDLLNAHGMNVDGFQQKVERVIEALFCCFARWPGLAGSPQFSRLVPLVAVDLTLKKVGKTVQPLFSAFATLSGFDPMFAPVTGSSHAAYRWCKALRSRCESGPVFILPVLDYRVCDPAEAGTNFFALPDALCTLNDAECRRRLIKRMGSSLEDGQSIAICSDEFERRGCTVSLTREERTVVLRLALTEKSDLSAFAHPLAAVLPTMQGAEGFIDTEPWPGATFEFLDKRLCGPELQGASAHDSLLLYLARVAAGEGPGHTEGQQPFSPGIGKRFVEPGVGRTCLVDFVRAVGRADLHDFSVTGVGLTPYSRGGFVDPGSPITGRAALSRAVHRKRCAARLEAEGCRAAPVFAIINLPGAEIRMPDAASSAAALVVRGFRCVLRIKQLDPVACFYHSLQHGAGLAGYLNDRRWEPGGADWPENLHARTVDWRRAVALDRQGALPDELHRIAQMASQPGINGGTGLVDPEAGARMRRMYFVRAYAPLLFGVAKTRLAMELGRDPDREPLSDTEYLTWFIGALARQMAIMQRLKFLHDYHHEGTARYSPHGIHTLVDNNVTILAEFPDLDTSVFVDRTDAEMLDELRLSSSDFQTLRSDFDRFHRFELAAVKEILRTLTAIIFHGDANWEARAMAHFDRVYEDSCQPSSQAHKVVAAGDIPAFPA